MESEGFPVLPQEIQLIVLSELKATDLNAVRGACRQLRTLIDCNCRRLYESRWVNATIKMRKPLIQVIILFENAKKKFRLSFSQDSLICNAVKVFARPDSEEYDDDDDYDDRDQNVFAEKTEWEQTLKDDFFGRPFFEFFDILAERSGGLSLTLTGIMDPILLEVLRPQLARTRKLTLDCEIDTISREVAFAELLSPRRQLCLNCYVFHSRPDIVDDEFCQSAASGKLELIESYPYVRLTDAQLLTLTTRKDLKELVIHIGVGPSLEGMRAAIQEILVSTMKCEITIEGLPRDPNDQATIDSVFSRQRGTELVVVSQNAYRRSRYTEYQYSTKDRLVSATAIIDDDASRMRISANFKREFDDLEELEVLEDSEDLVDNGNADYANVF